MISKIKEFIKTEVVLCIAAVLALVSEIVVRSSLTELAEFVDFRVLVLLFCLMGVMVGLREIGVFKKLAALFIGKVSTIRGIALVLVMLCFFLAMFITNDVALITFVPFAILMLDMTDNRKYLAYIITLQTIAANLGSMILPVGNPQNLYLYNVSGKDFGDFILLMLPYTLTSFVLLIIGLFFIKNEKITEVKQEEEKMTKADKAKLAAFILLFILCLLCVMRVLNFILLFGICLVAFIILDYKNVKSIDYCLLMTFICFFIFVGNVGKIGPVKDALSNVLTGREVGISFLLSQVISNVPAATLLAGFTTNYDGLIIGTNIGGLGTIIASLASLISFKFYAETGEKKSKYMICFTIANVIFALVLFLVKLVF